MDDQEDDRARSLSPPRGREGRSRARNEGNGRRISRSATRPSQQVWALNPLVSVQDSALEAAGEEDKNFKDAVTRARAVSQSEQGRNPSPSVSSLPRNSYSTGDPLLKGGYKFSSSGSPQNSPNLGPSNNSPQNYLDSPHNHMGFFGRKKPKGDMELKELTKHEMILNIAVQPPSESPSNSPILRSMMGRDDIAALKRNSRSATEATSIIAGTQCPECKTLIPGTFEPGAKLICVNAKCGKLIKVGDRLSLAECQACFTWALVGKAATYFKCAVCRQQVELIPMNPAEVQEVSRHSASEQIVDAAVHGLLSTWEMIRAGADALLPNPVRTSFINWSQTIVTNFSVLEPKDDDQIRKLIFEAQAAGLTLRVLGHGHSQSPSVCGNNEPGVLLIRLNRYGQETNGISDFEWVGGEQGDPTRDVTINAGWSLAQLYGRTVPKGYFLFSQTAACPFSIGGFYMHSVHGSAHAESIMSTRCVGLRVIKYDGSIIEIDKEKDLRMWRSSYGAGGVVTHVTIRMRRFTSITNSHVNYQFAMTPEKVHSCIFESLGGYHACEFFWDPYGDELVIARWKGEDDGGPSHFERKNVDEMQFKNSMNMTHGLPVGGDAFAKIVPDSVHTWAAREVNLQAAFTGLRHFLTKDAAGPDAMFIVDWVPRCVFLAYFIPIQSADDVLKALQAVKDVIAWGRETNQAYGIDCPVEFRFVRGNSNAVFTPLWEPAKDSQEDPSNFTEKQLYMNIEVIAYTKELDQKFSPHSHLDNPYTASWQEFWYRVEQKWRAMEGARPHPAKLFGLEPRPAGGYRAFAPQYVHEVWTPTQKRWIRKWLAETDPPQVFTRQYLKQLLADPSPIDRIDADEVLLHATKLPDATHTTINNINDYKGLWFVIITLPYWFSGMLVHSAGLVLFLVLAVLGLFQGQCDEEVFGYVIRDCGTHPLCTETAMHWIQAWFLYRGMMGLFVAPFHLIINCRRFALCCQRLKKHAPSWSKPNSDDNSKWFWRCVPICDIMISFTLGFGLICMQHMYECGLIQVFCAEAISLAILLGVLCTRMAMRLKGQYYRFFHYNGNGTFFAQKGIKASFNPFHRLNDRRYL